ncbi:hypothetical protein CHS0354_007469, partial [Potamilus streckersoni]
MGESSLSKEKQTRKEHKNKLLTKIQNKRLTDATFCRNSPSQSANYAKERKEIRNKTKQVKIKGSISITSPTFVPQKKRISTQKNGPVRGRQ